MGAKARWPQFTEVLLGLVEAEEERGDIESVAALHELLSVTTELLEQVMADLDDPQQVS